MVQHSFLVANRRFIDADELPVLLAELLCADVIVDIQAVSELRISVGEHQRLVSEDCLELGILGHLVLPPSINCHCRSLILVSCESFCDYIITHYCE